MNREALVPAFLALVCVLAVVFAAATLNSTSDAGGDGFGSGGGGGAGADRGEAVDLGGDEGEREGAADLGEAGDAPPVCVHFLKNPLVMLATLGLFVGMAVYVWRRMDLVASAGVTAGVGLPALLVYLLLADCQRSPQQQVQQGLPEMLSQQPQGGGSGAGTAGESGVVQTLDLPLVLLVVLGVAVVGALALVLSRRGSLSVSLSSGLSPVLSRDDDEESDQVEVFDGDPAGVGRAAGRAADRIEADADVENEVYRAWVEMTRHLDVEHPESSTPAEFAGAAVAAGMDREDVDELTRLFEEVRYGGHDATEDRERRAVAALRRIESAYAGDGE